MEVCRKTGGNAPCTDGSNRPSSGYGCFTSWETKAGIPGWIQLSVSTCGEKEMSGSVVNTDNPNPATG
jgi:hypothetical protein